MEATFYVPALLYHSQDNVQQNSLRFGLAYCGIIPISLFVCSLSFSGEVLWRSMKTSALLVKEVMAWS